MIALFLLTLVLAASAQNVNFLLGCNRYPQVCNNKCYAIFRGGAPQTITYSRVSEQTMRTRRQTAGTVPNPCCAGTITVPPTCSDTNGNEVACTSPDEYPYASSNEYGNGPGNGPTFIRCTGEDENLQEGRDLQSYAYGTSVENGGCGQRRGCRVTVGFSFVTIESDACVNRDQARNDGHYYQYNGAYTLAKRDDAMAFAGIYERANPPDELWIAPEQRRELLLDNGVRVLVAPERVGDPERPWIGETWLTDVNTTARVVRELFGEEKSPHFR